MRKKIFSILVLIAIVALYLVLAAIVFQHLESEKETELHEQYFKLFEDFKLKYNLTEELMVKISKVHEEACQLGIPNTKNLKWSFFGSLYFAGTVVTTIGYGHTAPLTLSGRIAFILFALTSIPLYMLLLNMLIEVSVTSLTRTYKDLCNRFKNKNAAQRRKDIEKLQSTGKINVRGVLLLISLALSIFSTGTSAMFSYIEDWSYFEGLYFILVSFTTVGLGDFVPLKETTSNNTHDVLYLWNLVVIILGTILTYIFLNLLATVYRQALDHVTGSSVAQKKEWKTQESIRAPELRRKNGVSRFNESTNSNGNVDSNAMGSFGAIQRALETIRKKAEENNYDKVSELKAVSTIEAILKDEFMKIRRRQGNDVRCKWQRAAAKARLSDRREQSRKASSNERIDASSTAINLENPDFYQNHKEDTRSKFPSFIRREHTVPANLASLNIKSFKESNTKLEFTQNRSLENSITLQKFLAASMSQPISRKITSSTYLSTEDESLHGFSPMRSRKISRPRSVSQYGYTNEAMASSNDNMPTFDDIVRQQYQEGNDRRNSIYFTTRKPSLGQESQHASLSKTNANKKNPHDTKITFNIQSYDDSSSSYDESDYSDDAFESYKMPNNNNLHPMSALPAHEADTLYRRYAIYPGT